MAGREETNSQCTLQVLKSRAFINPDRSATITITVAFTNPTPLVPHSTASCPTGCDQYAPGGPFTTGERYWWVAGLTNLGNWHGYTPIAPVLPTAAPGMALGFAQLRLDGFDSGVHSEGPETLLPGAFRVMG